MKRYLAIGILGIFLTGGLQAEELIQKIDVGVGIDIEAGGDDEEEEEPNFIWVGPGWYGGTWFGTEVEFNDWHDHHGWRHDHYYHNHGGYHHGHH